VFNLTGFTWITKTDQSFSIVEDEHFRSLLDYLKPNVSMTARRTLMRRMSEIYDQQKDKLKKELHSFDSKLSITCDIWTAKNQLSFFGFTVHYIDDQWEMQEKLLAFKYVQERHSGKNLATEVMNVLDSFEISERLLGVTCDNASNNTKMMAYLEEIFKEKYPNAGFSVDFNQIECIAHIINLGAQQILKDFKEPIDADDYESDSNLEDRLVSSVSRLAFLRRKVRKSPLLRQLMKEVCAEMNSKYLVPKIDVKTRWNSTFDMLVRAVKFKRELSQTFFRFGDKSLVLLRFSIFFTQ
jgi:hypothetical protein